MTVYVIHLLKKSNKNKKLKIKIVQFTKIQKLFINNLLKGTWSRHPKNKVILKLIFPLATTITLM